MNTSTLSFMRQAASRIPTFQHLLLVGALAFAFGSGCGSRSDIKPITEWQRYEDPGIRIAFSYPKGWTANADGGTITITSSSAAVAKFLDPGSNAPDGAQIVVTRTKLDTLESAEAYIKSYSDELSAGGFKVEPAKGRMLAGMPAAGVVLSGAYSKDAKLHAERVAIVKDSIQYTVHVGTFNDYTEAYKQVIDSVLASFTIIAPEAASAAMDPSMPSKTFDSFDNFAVRIQYPNNFDAAIPSSKKGEALFSMDLKGYRQDCSIHIDILPAKGLNVDKVVEQNMKFYKSTSRGETKIDGQKAIYLSYAPAKGIQSRVYFVVKGDKLARVITNIYTPMKDVFQPVFEKSIASLRIK